MQHTQLVLVLQPGETGTPTRAQGPVPQAAPSTPAAHALIKPGGPGLASQRVTGPCTHERTPVQSWACPPHSARASSRPPRAVVLRAERPNQKGLLIIS